MDPNSTLFVLDDELCVVCKYDSSLNFLGRFGDVGTGDGEFEYPTAITADSAYVYVADEQDVASVTVDGHLLMRDGEFLTIDTERVRREATELAARIQTALAERNR